MRGPGPGFTELARRLGGVILAALFAGSVAATPLSMATCPRHDAGLHAPGMGASGHSMPHFGRTGSPEDGPREPHGPCRCLDHCCPGAVLVGTVPPSAAAPIAPRSSHAAPVAPRSEPTFASNPWMLPYPNGPPALV